MAFVYPYKAVSTSSSEVVLSARLYPQPLVKRTWWRLWWHTKAYGVIAGVIIVAIASLLFLQLHWLQRQIIRLVSSTFNHDTDPVL